MKKMIIFIATFCFLLCFSLLPFVHNSFAQDGEELFTVSGFIDLQYQGERVFDSDLSLLKTDPGQDNGQHFSLNNVNLYFAFNPTDGWTAFTEVRLLFFPSGTESIDNNTYIKKPFDNLVWDNLSNTINFGSIFIERAYIEWNALSYASIRAGRYLTPFGIWSQDHGAPVLTSVRIPYLAGSITKVTGMPLTQTGIEFFGKIDVPGTDNVMLEYAAYTANGVNDNDAFFDQEDNDFSYGGFTNLKLMSIGDFINVECGVSAYRGKRTFIYSKSPSDSLMTAMDPAMVSYVPSDILYLAKQLDTIGVAHMKVTMESLPFEGIFTIQAEWMDHRVDEPKNDTRLVNSMGNTRTPEDYHVKSYYIQAEYQLFGFISPYYRYDKTTVGQDNDLLQTVLFKDLILNSFGINIKPTSVVTLKFEYYIIDMSSPIDNILGSGFTNDFKTILASATMVF